MVVGYIYQSIESGAATQEKSPCHSDSLKSAFTERKTKLVSRSGRSEFAAIAA
jgi:hypothetical protein